MATLICIRTAFSAVPQNHFILRCSFSHLKNNSANHLFYIDSQHSTQKKKIELPGFIGL